MSGDQDPRTPTAVRKRDGTGGTVTLAQLEGFLAIISQGGIKRGADKLNIDESTLRERINKLEAWLDKTLFFRKPTFRLAPDGSNFRGRAEAIVMSIYEARANMGFEKLYGLTGQALVEAVGPPMFNAVTGSRYYEID